MASKVDAFLDLLLAEPGTARPMPETLTWTYLLRRARGRGISLDRWTVPHSTERVALMVKVRVQATLRGGTGDV